ncbi:MAG: N-succinylglutamate 5-semialdehyde dehydrogenase [Chlamydiales bacterium]|nr:N-succinylglutamate 5-semialdehyde dehydrogenase [Chlamydiales bacterium]
MKGHYISGEWVQSIGETFSSINPATGEVNWTGNEAIESEVNDAVFAARTSFASWAQISFQERCAHLHQFEKNLKNHQKEFEETISKECGKPLWESKLEITTLLQKLAISIKAHHERCPDKKIETSTSTLTLHHKPHGVVAIFGPFNFPAHLPHSHLIPALLAGNCAVLKGSEQTPLVTEMYTSFWNHLPKGVLNMVQGGVNTGRNLASHPQIDGLFFTGSHPTGTKLLKEAHPEKIISLEMGGNNPLIFSDVADLEAAAYLTIQSAFLTTGQRCTSARRLILPTSKQADEFLKVLIHMTEAIQVGSYKEKQEPYIGPVISLKSAENLLNAQASLGAQGGRCLTEMYALNEHLPFLKPGIMDVTEATHRLDIEYFGPFLQVIRTSSFEEAVVEANRTKYGLSASILTHSKEKFEQFYQEIRAGLINWNTPTTGASSKVPFGGVGASGNHRPSGYYASDYCSYPVTSVLSKQIQLPTYIPPGITFLART